MFQVLTFNNMAIWGGVTTVTSFTYKAISYTQTLSSGANVTFSLFQFNRLHLFHITLQPRLNLVSSRLIGHDPIPFSADPSAGVVLKRMLRLSTSTKLCDLIQEQPSHSRPWDIKL